MLKKVMTCDRCKETIDAVVSDELETIDTSRPEGWLKIQAAPGEPIWVDLCSKCATLFSEFVVANDWETRDDNRNINMRRVCKDALEVAIYTYHTKPQRSVKEVKKEVDFRAYARNQKHELAENWNITNHLQWNIAEYYFDLLGGTMLSFIAQNRVERAEEYEKRQKRIVEREVKAKYESKMRLFKEQIREAVRKEYEDNAKKKKTKKKKATKKKR